MHNLPDWTCFPQSSAAEMHESEKVHGDMTVVFKVMTGGNDGIPGVPVSHSQLIVKQTHSKPGEEIRRKKSHTEYLISLHGCKTTIITFFKMLDVTLPTDSPDSKQQSVRVAASILCKHTATAV